MNMQDYIHAAERIEIDNRCREEILNMTADTTMKTARQKKPAIRIATGFAVAAAVLALNGALVFAIYSARHNIEFPGTASESEAEVSVFEDEQNPAESTTPEQSGLSGAESEPEVDLSVFEDDLHPINNTGSELPVLSFLGWDRYDFRRMKEPFAVSIEKKGEWNYTEEIPATLYTQYRDDSRNVILMDSEQRIHAIYTNYDPLRKGSGLIDPDTVGKQHLNEEELTEKAESIMRELMPDYDLFTFLAVQDDTDVAGEGSNPFYYFMLHDLSDSFKYQETAGITLKADGTIHQFAVSRMNREADIDLSAYDKAAAEMSDWLQTENTELVFKQMEDAGGHLIAVYNLFDPQENKVLKTVLVSPEFTLPERNPDYPYRIKENMLEGMPAAERSKEYNIGKLEITGAQVFDDEISVSYSFTPSDYLDKKVDRNESENISASCSVMGKIYDENGKELGVLLPLQYCYGFTREYTREPMNFRQELKAVSLKDYKYDDTCFYNVTSGEGEYLKLEIPENAYIWLYLHTLEVTGVNVEEVSVYCDFQDYIDSYNHLATRHAACCKVTRGNVSAGEEADN